MNNKIASLHNGMLKSFFPLLIILFIAFTLIVLLINRKCKDKQDKITVGDYFYFSFISIISYGAIFLILIGFIRFYLLLSEGKEKLLVYNREVSVQAMEDNMQVGGRAFLGTGTINNDIYYYYIENQNGKSQIKKIRNSDNIYIVEEENTDKAKIIYYKCEYASENLRKINASQVIDDREMIEIHIPKGSLKVNYNIDLK